MQTSRPDEEVPVLSSTNPSGERSAKSWILLWWSFVFALLQSLCTAVIAVSGIRVLIGLSALAAAAGCMFQPPVSILTLSVFR